MHRHWVWMRSGDRKKKSGGALYFIILGVISVIWFLVRVIPKPSRISYPCQRMAAANAVAFITWLLGTALAGTFFKKAFRKLKESRVSAGVVLMVLAIGVGTTTVMLTYQKEIQAAINRSENIPYNPTDLNQPVGEARGIFPGRVTWAHYPEAVRYDPSTSNGFWWEDQNTDPERVDRMLSLSLGGISGAATVKGGWDQLFRYNNIKRGKGDLSWSSGEKVAIKVNMLMGLRGGEEEASHPGPSPQLLMAIVEDLIVELGIPGDLITVYDVSARMPDYIMEPFKNHENAEFQMVRFVGNPGYLAGEHSGRYIAAREDLEAEIHFADTSVTHVFLVKSVTESDYLINLANLKAHTMAGVTMVAKNHYGSIFIPTATREFWDESYTYGFGPPNSTDSLGNVDPHRGLHKCAAVHDFNYGGLLPAREMGTFNYLVDIMGHPEIYSKTILYVIDALYGCDSQSTISKFESFGNHYSSSLLLSQDPVAIESVGLDFLRNEPACDQYVHGYVDNWLHESAQADNPPSGINYNPGNRESGLQSLGVHEHWNSWEEKQYSRNLGTGDGIELFTLDLCELKVSLNVSGDTSVCSSDGLILEVISESQGLTYAWYKEDQVISGESNSTLHIQESGLYYVNVVGPECSQLTDSVFVSYQNNLVYTDTMICAGDSCFLGGAYQKIQGTYYDTILFDSNGCDSITITDLIVSQPSQYVIDTSICQGESYVAGGMAQTVPGTYYDTLINNSGCDSIVVTNLQIEVCSSIELSNGEDVKIYPVPTTGILNIQTGHLISAKLYTLTGTLILNTQESKLDFRNYSPGIYLLSIHADGGKVTLKKIIYNGE